MAASLLSMTMSSSLLLLFTLLLLHPCCANGREVETAADSHLNRRLHGAEVHRTFFCSLEDAPITQVAINETIGKVYQYQESDRNTTSTPQQTYAVKACSCYSGLLNGTSYCPANSDYCHISVAYNTYYRQITSRMEGHDPSVACFRDTHLKSFARSHVIRHVRSRYNPDVNKRYVEQRLRMEIESERQRFFQWRERFIAEGNFVGLKIKTKMYHPKSRKDKHVQDEGVDSCSICILDLKDRERIADLNCNHYFHADCLSEWIKKKNSCPLCQEGGIAKEVRSYDIEIGPNADTIENADALNGLSTGND
eukprot:scaffold6495_cov155-Skeletonema_marinoi.AAC.10